MLLPTPFVMYHIKDQSSSLKVVVTVEVRVGSSRLPVKVLAPMSWDLVK